MLLSKGEKNAEDVLKMRVDALEVFKEDTVVNTGGSFHTLAAGGS